MKFGIIEVALICTALLTSYTGSPICNAFIAPDKINGTMLSAWHGKILMWQLTNMGHQIRLANMIRQKRHARNDGQEIAASRQCHLSLSLVNELEFSINSVN